MSYGSSKFLIRLIPISKLTSAFLLEQIELTIQAITCISTDVKAILCDGKPSKLSFFKSISYTPRKNLG